MTGVTLTEAQLAFVTDRHLATLSTVRRDGTPHVVPVGFRYNPDEGTIDIGGLNFANSKKYRDALRNPRVAFVVDDVPSINPWRARGVEVRGEAEVLTTGGKEIMADFADEMLRIRPRRIVGWGIEGDDPFAANARDAVGGGQ